MISPIVHFPPSVLKPYSENARTHSEQQIDVIVKGIQEYGFYNPIIVDHEFTIIAGHGRYMAAQKLQLEKVPVIVLDGLTDSKRRALTLYDNKTSLMAGWDIDLLRSELDFLSQENFDLELTAFQNFEIEQFLIQDEYTDHSDRPIQSERSEPSQNVSAGTNDEPKELRFSDNEDYSDEPKLEKFELMMSGENKADLIFVLQQIKRENFYESLEESMVDIVKLWKENR